MAGLSTYETHLIVNARCALLFAELYDALPGSCIQPVEEDTVRILNHALEITARLKAKYCIVLSAGQEKIADGVTTDTYDTPFGYRTIKYTADDGFFCNDKTFPCRLRQPSGFHGLWRGNSDTISEYRMARLKECGFDIFRTAHNPFAPALYDACDRLGL